MPMSQTPMQNIKEILRLHSLNYSNRKIAKSCNVSPSTVHLCLLKAKVAGVTWPIPEDWDDQTIIAKLYPSKEKPQQYALPDCHSVHQSLKNKGVTLQLLWQEYHETNPHNAYSYAQFCNIYRNFKNQLDISMRQTHKAGEKLFVDYAGLTLALIDSQTGEVQPVYIFVAAMGASQFIFAKASLHQDIPSFITAHVEAFNFLGGVPEILVPDNLKAGVTKACHYEPALNRTYQEMATHYGAVIIPARVRKPRDKAKVENAVQQVERWVLAPLRKQQFFHLADINQSMKQLLQQLNQRPLSYLNLSREQLFQQTDKPALKTLPQQSYDLAVWKCDVGVNIDYHIAVEKHFYSVPFQYRNKRVDVRLGTTTLECFYQSRRIASHIRSYEPGKASTQNEHRPKNHADYGDWSAQRLLGWAQKIGSHTTQFVQTLLVSKPHPEQSFRAVLGVLRLGKTYGHNRLETACHRANALNIKNYHSIKNMLQTGFEQLEVPPEKPQQVLPQKHQNVRGPDYYH